MLRVALPGIIGPLNCNVLPGLTITEEFASVTVSVADGLSLLDDELANDREPVLR
jgi:hypothetical protein